MLLARYRQALAARDPALLAGIAERFDRLPEAEKTAPVVDAAAHARFLGVENPFNEFIAIQFNHRVGYFNFFRHGFSV